jgi:hypothetical protein
LDIQAAIAPVALRWPTGTIHWDRLREAVEVARAIVGRVDAECRAVEQDKDLSPEGASRRRADIGRRALQELENFRPLRAAEQAVERAVALFESQMTDLPKPPSSTAEVALAQEVRAHITRQSSPPSFVLGHLHDPHVVGAVLHAPGFLSGLSKEALGVVRERSRAALHPDQVKLQADAAAALAITRESVEAARRMVFDRTGARLDRGDQPRGV